MTSFSVLLSQRDAVMLLEDAKLDLCMLKKGRLGEIY